MTVTDALGDEVPVSSNIDNGDLLVDYTFDPEMTLPTDYAFASDMAIVFDDGLPIISPLSGPLY